MYNFIIIMQTYEYEYGYRSGISNTMREHLKNYQEEILTIVKLNDGDTLEESPLLVMIPKEYFVNSTKQFDDLTVGQKMNVIVCGSRVKFNSKNWSKNKIKDEGGGEFRILKNGKIFEKVGVNFSEVYGKFSNKIGGKCESCQPGYATSIVGSINCIKCSPGKFTNGNSAMERA